MHRALHEDVKNGTDIYVWRNSGKDVALGVARGLNFLHSKGVIHRFGCPLTLRAN